MNHRMYYPLRGTLGNGIFSSAAPAFWLIRHNTGTDGRKCYESESKINLNSSVGVGGDPLHCPSKQMQGEHKQHK